MLAENYTYFRSNKIVMNMVNQGMFGETTSAECGYTHDTRYLQFNADGSSNWRSERAKLPGKRYPMHAIGTVSQWLGVNRGDRFVSLVSMAGPAKALNYDLAKRFGPDSPQAKTKFAADSVATLLKTSQGKLVELRFNLYSPKPEPGLSFHNLIGTKATYKDEDDDPKIWLEGRSAKYHREPLSLYQKEFDHPLWKKCAAEALKTGHRGAAFVQLMDFVSCLREGRPSPIDVYDGATWSAIIELSARSVTSSSSLEEFPDFTGGQWKNR
jgi:Glycosyl hydrolase 109, C-terminal domain